MKRYVDTSILVSFVVNEVHTEHVRARMRDPAVENVISDWTVTEFYAALSLKLRTSQITSDVKREAEAFFEQARARLFTTVAVQRLHFMRAAVLGARSELGLRAGDALHLAIAEQMQGTLWTVDQRFQNAAQLIGMATEAG